MTQITQERIHPEAILIRSLESWRGNAKLYSVYPPITYYDQKIRRTAYHVIIVSNSREERTGDAVGFLPQERTSVFPAMKSGNTKCFKELNGSCDEIKDHSDVLTSMGYELILSENEGDRREIRTHREMVSHLN